VNGNQHETVTAILIGFPSSLRANRGMTVRSGPGPAGTRCACLDMSVSLFLLRARRYPRPELTRAVVPLCLWLGEVPQQVHCQVSFVDRHE
jgi:hypothetical protein